MAVLDPYNEQMLDEEFKSLKHRQEFEAREDARIRFTSIPPITAHCPDLTSKQGLVDLITLRNLVILFIPLTAWAYAGIEGDKLPIDAALFGEIQFLWRMAIRLERWLDDQYVMRYDTAVTPSMDTFSNAADFRSSANQTFQLYASSFEKQILLVVAGLLTTANGAITYSESEDVPGCDEDPALTDRQMDNLGLYSALRCRLQDDKDDFEYLVKWTGATLPFPYLRSSAGAEPMLHALVYETGCGRDATGVPQVAYEPLVLEALRDPDTAFRSLIFQDDNVLFRVCMESNALWGKRSSYARTGVSTAILYGISGALELITNRRPRSCNSARIGFNGAAYGGPMHLDGVGAHFFRYMLTQTDAIVSGFFVVELVRMNSRTKPSIDCMDLYVTGDTGTRLVGRYLEMADYKKLRWELSDMPYVHATTTYAHWHTNFKIRVHSCIGQSRMAVLRGPLTCNFAWMCGKGVFLAYPGLTLDGLSMLSHANVPLRNDEDCHALAALMAAANHHDISVVMFRSTGWHRGVWRRELKWDLYWMLGAMGCAVENRGLEFELSLGLYVNRTCNGNMQNLGGGADHMPFCQRHHYSNLRKSNFELPNLAPVASQNSLKN
ncbi:hypothetical protein B0H12DRAFT_1083250 [Mycena haematopus]|nr:hypothetical protein B0H12DRAFT_1083250 [Mycena haematopus]